MNLASAARARLATLALPPPAANSPSTRASLNGTCQCQPGENGESDYPAMNLAAAARRDRYIDSRADPESPRVRLRIHACGESVAPLLVLVVVVVESAPIRCVLAASQGARVYGVYGDTRSQHDDARAIRSVTFGEENPAGRELTSAIMVAHSVPRGYAATSSSSGRPCSLLSRPAAGSHAKDRRR